MADGGSVRADGLTSRQASFTSCQDKIPGDATSALEIGSAGGAAAGALQIDAGPALGIDLVTGQMTIDANVANNETILANGDNVMDIAGPLTGSGTIEFAAAWFGSDLLDGVALPLAHVRFVSGRHQCL